MFGHTFLRVNSKNKNLNQQDLLDWGISYAAQVAEDENGFAFVFLTTPGHAHRHVKRLRPKRIQTMIAFHENAFRWNRGAKL